MLQHFLVPHKPNLCGTVFPWFCFIAKRFTSGQVFKTLLKG